MVKKTLLMGMLAIVFVCVSACTTQAPDSDAVAIAVEGTMTAVASEATPLPTATSSTTATATSTATPAPTNTPTSTYTPTRTPTPGIYDLIPPRGDYQHDYEIIEYFDKFDKETRVAVSFSDPTLLTFISPDSPEAMYPIEFGITAKYYYEGTDPAPPSMVFLSVSILYESWKYMEKSCDQFDLLLDESLVISHQDSYESSVEPDYTWEIVTIELTLSEFLKVVSAEKVEGRVCIYGGTEEFALSNMEMAALRDCASRMLPEH